MEKEKINLVEMRIQSEAFYALKVPSKNTEKLFDEITSLLEVDKDKFQYAPIVLEIENKRFMPTSPLNINSNGALCLNFLTPRFNHKLA
jgi:hypothetical protein